MKYEIHKKSDSILVGVEATFTLIDFLLFFSSFLLGFVIGLFFLIFAAAVLQKIFARYEFEFNTDRYEIIKYYRIFGYIRFRQQSIPFSQVEYFLLSNYDSGPALKAKGFKRKEWHSIIIHLKNSILQLAKAEEDELHEVNELYQDLEENLSLYFQFKTEFIQPDTEKM